MTRSQGRCSRPSCTRTAWVARQCEVHWWAMKRAGLAGRVDPTPVRQHIARLHTLGFTNRDISDLADVSFSCVVNQSNGTPKTIRAAEARRILSVRPDAVLPHRTNFTIDGTGFNRRVQAMNRMGWPVPSIAERAGVKAHAIYDAVCQGRVSRALFRAVDAVFSDLAYRQGPSKQAATKAAQKGWVTAMAWENIDDPGEQPETGAVKRTSASADEVVFLSSFGESVPLLAQRFGVSEQFIKSKLRSAA